MTDFTAEEALIRLVASGNAEIAELLRLRKFIPEVFRSEKIDPRYAEIIYDFSYFQKSDVIVKKLNASPELLSLDAKFCEEYIEILTRFYQSFESIHLYVLELKSILQELNDGLFIQQTLESVFESTEGRQLLVESLYLYGIMLLVVDKFIPDMTRERLLVSYYRYRTDTQGESTIDEVCKLLRTTEQDKKLGGRSRTSSTYPEDYFGRITIDETFISMVIAHLRTDDIYHQVPVYPVPEHRTTALATQASILYVCLFFSPATLHRGEACMREIVDKFFPDNWTLSLYMGITTNLIDSWAPFKAARAALGQTIAPANVKEVAAKQRKNLIKCHMQVESILKDCNQLTESFFTKNMANMMNLLTRCNVTLRWMVLHTTSPAEVNDKRSSKESEKTLKLVLTDTEISKLTVFKALQSISQLEVRVRQIIRHLLDEKGTLLEKYRAETTGRIDELVAAFSGEKPLLKIVLNADLQTWFGETSRDIKQLSFTETTATERKIIHIIKALEEVQQYHNLDANMQVKQHLTESLDYLHRMLHTINVTEDTLIRAQIIGDISYAWILIDQYTEVMRESIASPPYLVINLRAIFVKLSTALEIPLLRINQAKSDDLESVSHYYSYQLVDYVRRVVDIIPKNIFRLITENIYEQTQAMKEMPTRIEKSALRDYAQLNHRKCISSVAENVTALTEGILQMRKTLVGVVEVDPKELLEDGIRKELRTNLHNVIRRDLWFVEQRQPVDINVNLESVIKSIDRYRWSFEYVQDYLHINGSNMFEEEMSKMVNDCVEYELAEMKRSHNPNAPNLKFRNHSTEKSQTFIGNFARTLLQLTDTLQSTYLEQNRQWISSNTRSHKERFNMKTIAHLSQTIGPTFLVGINTLFAQIIFFELDDFFGVFRTTILADSSMVALLSCLAPDSLSGGVNPLDAVQYEVQLAKILGRFNTKLVQKFMAWIVDAGRIQLLRNEFTLELNQMCRVNSQQLESSLGTLNRAFNQELEKVGHSKNSEPTTIGADLLTELNAYLTYAGLQRPMRKVYVSLDEQQTRNCALFLVVIVIAWAKRNRGQRSPDTDDQPFISGVATWLQQLDSAYVEVLFIQPMCGFIRFCMTMSTTNDSVDIRNECTHATYVLNHIMRTMRISSDVFYRYCPRDLIDAFQCASNMQA